MTSTKAEADAVEPSDAVAQATICKAGSAPAPDIMGNRALLAGCFAAVAILAGATFLTPRLLPALSRTLRIGTARAGSFFTSYFFGYFTSALVGGALSDILGRRRPFLGGVVLIGASLLVIGFSPGYYSVLTGMLLLGIGAGLVEGLVSALMADLTENRGLLMNLAQVSFNLGALVVPFFAAYCETSRIGWRGSYFIVGLLALALAAFLAGQIFPPFTRVNRLGLREFSEFMGNPTFWVLSFSMAAYVGAEQGLASWLSYLLSSGFAAQDTLVSLSLSVFWGAMIPGRLACGWLTLKVDPRRLVFFSFAGSFVMFAGLYLVSDPVNMVILAGMIGLVMAGTWPTILATAADYFPGQAGAALGVIIASGSFGGMVFPWLIGVAAEHLGLGPAISITGGILSIAGCTGFGYLIRRKPESSL